MDLRGISQFNAGIFIGRTDSRLLSGPMLGLNGNLIANEDMSFSAIAGYDMGPG